LTASEPLLLEEEFNMQVSWQNDNDKCTFIVLDKKKYDETTDEVSSMIGDTNLYLTDCDNPSPGEIEVMIAEKDARRGGRGREATMMMLRYCVENLKVSKFLAKIGYANEPSMKLFRSLHFKEISRSEVFQELTFELVVADDWKRWLSEGTSSYVVSSYEYNGRY
ncbi:GNAT domain, partial [Trinorchestia longiramus]